MNPIPQLVPHDKSHYTSRFLHTFPDPREIFKTTEPILLYGASRMGKIFLTNLTKQGIPVHAFIDKNPVLIGTRINRIPVISISEAQKSYKHAHILICSLMYESEIYTLLKKHKFTTVYPLYLLNMWRPDMFISAEYRRYFPVLFSPQNQQQITDVMKKLRDAQSKKVLKNNINFRLSGNKTYIHTSKTSRRMFDEPGIFRFSQNEIFADCGGYTGDSIQAFVDQVKNTYETIYSFEPDSQNFTVLEKFVNNSHLQRIIPVPMGVYSKKGSLRFSSAGTVDSRINTEGNTTIPVTTLDVYFRDKKPPTFIKMDIEGVEKHALLGAKKLLNTVKPKLAISIYHHATDIWKLPLLITKLNPSYRLYMRHYTDEIVDTLCYAV